MVLQIEPPPELERAYAHWRDYIVKMSETVDRIVKRSLPTCRIKNVTVKWSTVKEGGNSVRIFVDRANVVIEVKTRRCRPVLSLIPLITSYMLLQGGDACMSIARPVPGLSLTMVDAYVLTDEVLPLAEKLIRPVFGLLAGLGIIENYENVFSVVVRVRGECEFCEVKFGGLIHDDSVLEVLRQAYLRCLEETLVERRLCCLIKVLLHIAEHEGASRLFEIPLRREGAEAILKSVELVAKILESIAETVEEGE